MADFRFDESANIVYHFVWDRFCDWYLELIKPVLTPAEGAEADAAQAGETRTVAGWVLDQILVMLHPFMPFITEELWHAMGDRPYDLILAKWPMPDARSLDPAAAAEVEWLIDANTAIRSAKSELGISPSIQLEGYFVVDTAIADERFSMNERALKRLTRTSHFWRPASGGLGRPNHPPVPDGPKLVIPVDGATFYYSIEGVVDVSAERARLTKSLETAKKERDGLAQRLGNPSFVERAKPEAVAKARDDHRDKTAEADRLETALGRLG
jgi:valyl-tRNA synthetase